jgi:tRNA modification GTPase
MSSSRDTIFALSSGRGPSAIAVIRISGPRAGDALKALAGKIPEPRKAGFARVRDPRTREIIDEALALWFPGPNSETGEDAAELQLHGGRAIIAAAFAALGSLEGLRPAEAGEFTRRAFENGKLDLTAVEGLADLVGAETEAQRRQAFRQMSGTLARQAEAWRARLVQALALVEARIDFSDEADVPEDLVAPALAIARELEAEIARALADAKRGERLREGLVVAIAGPPNAGKSTLLNRIARREAAIVSPYAGTTRDVIEVHLDLDGWPVTLLDTAGIRETDDPVEQEGVRRAEARAAAADLVLWVVDASAEGGAAAKKASRAAVAEARDTGAGSPPGDADEDATSRHPDGSAGTGPAVDRPGQGIGSQDTPNAPVVWQVTNKVDLVGRRSEGGAGQTSRNERKEQSRDSIIGIVDARLRGKAESEFVLSELEFSLSAANGEGVDALMSALAECAGQLLAGAEPALVSRERQRRALEDTSAALRRASTRPAAESEDLLAEELRLAAHGLARLTGRIDVEDVLDVIFRDFCIGK